MSHSIPSPRRREEARLLREYAENPSARSLDQLVRNYRPLARSLALRYRASSEPLDDLLQVADLGLVKAIKGFDPQKGKPLAAYAVPTILGELKRHFRDRVWNLRLPRSLQESAMKVDEATEALTDRHGRTPSVKEISAETDLDLDAVLDTLRAVEARQTLSLDGQRHGDEDTQPMIETIDCRELGYDRIEADFACSTADLDERERFVLALRFEGGMTQSDIGRQLGVSQMQISRISRKALRKLLAAVQAEPDGSPTDGEARRATVEPVPAGMI